MGILLIILQHLTAVNEWICDQTNHSYSHFHVWNGETVEQITCSYSVNQWKHKKQTWTSLGPSAGVQTSGWSVMAPCSKARHAAQACLCQEFDGRKAAFPPQNRFMNLGETRVKDLWPEVVKVYSTWSMKHGPATCFQLFTCSNIGSLCEVYGLSRKMVCSAY